MVEYRKITAEDKDGSRQKLVVRKPLPPPKSDDLFDDVLESPCFWNIDYGRWEYHSDGCPVEYEVIGICK